MKIFTGRECSGLNGLPGAVDHSLKTIQAHAKAHVLPDASQRYTPLIQSSSLPHVGFGDSLSKSVNVEHVDSPFAMRVAPGY